MAPDIPRRPGRGRIAAIALLGPPFGTAIVVLVAFIADPPPVDLFSDGGEMVSLLIGFGYFFGILPSVLAALLYSCATPQLATFWWRLLGCVFIGGFSGMFGVLVPVWIMARDFVFEPSFMLLAAMAGAVALPLTALPFSRPAS